MKKNNYALIKHLMLGISFFYASLGCGASSHQDLPTELETVNSLEASFQNQNDTQSDIQNPEVPSDTIDFDFSDSTQTSAEQKNPGRQNSGQHSPGQNPGQQSPGQNDYTALLQKFINQGAPRNATQRALEFLRLNYGKTVKILGANGYVTRKISNNNYLTVIDFTRPSSQKRMYLLNLKTGQVLQAYVAHGEASGGNDAVRFSNVPESKMSSLGFYLTDGTYVGSHGRSIYLLGMEKSNDRARQRMIVIHSADYVSETFIKQNHRLGRSWGCPAVSREVMPKLLSTIDYGAVVYAHHEKFMKQAQVSFDYQGIGDFELNSAMEANIEPILPGEESCIQHPELIQCQSIPNVQFNK